MSYRMEISINDAQGPLRSGALFGGEVRVYVDEDCEGLVNDADDSLFA